jgi:hypothetical protein
VSCSHGWHDCPPCGDVRYGRRWGDAASFDDRPEAEVRRGRESRRVEPGMDASELEARLADLHRIVRVLERDLEDLRSGREDTAT